MRQLLTAEPRGFRGLSAMRQKAPELRSLNAARGDRGNSLRPSTPPGTHSSLTSSYSQTSCAYSQSLIAALSSAPTADFALHGELLSLVWPRESNQREGHPNIRVWPAARLPSFRCHSGGRLTRAIHGPLSLSPHPCGSSPCATPPLGLLTGTRATRCLVVFLGAARIAPGWVPTWSVRTTKKGMQNFQATPNAPFRRPNGIIAEGVERHGCRERRDGPRMALRGAPLER